MKKPILLLLTAIVLVAGKIYSNGITIQKVSIVDTNRTAKTAKIKFNIAWENSWRDSINWDAAWIFVKFREPKDSVWRYRHMNMSTANNFSGIGSTKMKFSIPDDKKGVFYYRDSIGGGHIKMDSVLLLWNYGADGVGAIDSVEIKVFATEMVYVPSGSYVLGDGDGKQTKSNAAFQMKNNPFNYVSVTDKWSPIINTNNGDIYLEDINTRIDGFRISGVNGLDINRDKISEFPDYPTGYKAFYCMKYPCHTRSICRFFEYAFYRPF